MNNRCSISVSGLTSRKHVLSLVITEQDRCIDSVQFPFILLASVGRKRMACFSHINKIRAHTHTDVHTRSHAGARAHTHTRACARTYARRKTHVHTRSDASTHTHTRSDAGTHTDTHARTHARTHVRTHTRTHTHTHTHVLTRMLTHTHTHTHTTQAHTHAHTLSSTHAQRKGERNWYACVCCFCYSLTDCGVEVNLNLDPKSFCSPVFFCFLGFQQKHSMRTRPR